jgi:H+/Cl- antiporter ClcA
LIFISTLITHLFGGSAGREGAALQMGGSIGNAIGKFFRFDDKDKHVMIMCGMSAAFSALFGTPMAAAILPMEIVSVGVMYYTALVPCVISSLVAHGVAYLFGVSNQWFSIEHIPDFGILPAVQISILAVLCALVSIVFCILLHKSEEIYRKLFQNPYIRIFAGGCIVVILTMLVGNQNYNGTGIGIIQMCIDAGFDTIEHGTFMTLDHAKQMAEKGIAWTPTIMAYTYLYKLCTDSWCRLQRRRNCSFLFHRRGLWLPVWNADRHIPDTLYGCRHDCRILWCHKLSDHFAVNQF